MFASWKIYWPITFKQNTSFVKSLSFREAEIEYQEFEFYKEKNEHAYYSFISYS